MPVKNGLLIELVKRLSGSEPDWETLIRESDTKNKNTNNIVGQLAEAHIRISLEAISGDYEGRINLNPFPEDSRSRKYSFDKRGHNIIARKDGLDFCEYDHLILVDNLPVVFEVKVSRKRSHGKGSGNLGYKDVLRLDRIKKTLTPINEFFGVEDCGYVVFVSNLYGGPNVKAFTDRGGILARFYHDNQTFRKAVELATETYRR